MEKPAEVAKAKPKPKKKVAEKIEEREVRLNLFKITNDIICFTYNLYFFCLFVINREKHVRKLRGKLRRRMKQ